MTQATAGFRRKPLGFPTPGRFSVQRTVTTMTRLTTDDRSRPARSLTIAASAALAGFLAAAPLAAQSDLLEVQRIPAPYHPTNTNLDPGLFAIDVEGNRLVAGAMQMGMGSGSNAVAAVGAVYVMSRPNADAPFGLEQELRPSDPAPNRFFGREVAIDGTTIAVGGVDAIYVFEHNGSRWQQIQRISRSTVSRSFAIDGDVLAVGDWTQSVAGVTQAGRVRVFRRTNGRFVQEAVLTDPTPSAYDSLGKQVDASGDCVIAYTADRAGGFVHPGAMVFERQPNGNWRFQTKLQPDWGSGPQASTFRYSSMNVCGDTVLIQGESFAGIFTRTAQGWRNTQNLDKRVWGFALADRYQDLEQDRFVVSSYRRIASGPGYVSLVFRRDGDRWVKQAALTQSDGYGLANPQIDGNTVIATRRDALSGCLIGNPPTCGVGALYVYSLDEAGRGYGIGCPAVVQGFLGVPAMPDLALRRVDDGPRRLEFYVENAAPGSYAFLMIGGGRSMAPLGGGCNVQVSAPVLVGPIALLGQPGGASGTGSGVTALPLPPAVRGTVFAQMAVFDAASPNGVLTVTRAGAVDLR